MLYKIFIFKQSLLPSNDRSPKSSFSQTGSRRYPANTEFFYRENNPKKARGKFNLKFIVFCFYRLFSTPINASVPLQIKRTRYSAESMNCVRQVMKQTVYKSDLKSKSANHVTTKRHDVTTAPAFIHYDVTLALSVRTNGRLFC